MTAVVRGDALAVPLRDESVDLIVTSPPYFGQRSYRDGGEHYDGQIGSEPTPQAFLDALWAVTRECWRVLKPTGSMFVNLGDKRANRVASRRSSHQDGLFPGRPELAKDWKRDRALGLARMTGDHVFDTATGPRAPREKSKMLLPHRYAIGCEDGLADPSGIGWIVRQDLIWSKPNGLPESVRDRTRDAHEYWFHLCKQGDYFAAIDEIRQPYTGDRDLSRRVKAEGDGKHEQRAAWDTPHPLGALPSSVWSIATEPLTVPAHLGVDHFAAFPSEWPRRLILGFSPNGICTACGEPRRPVVRTQQRVRQATNGTKRHSGGELGHDKGRNQHGYPVTISSTTIEGYACACPDAIAPTRPAVVLDPFGGTGTTVMVARALGRTGISLDLSSDYCRLARWRVFDSPGAAKVADRTAGERQGALL